MNPQACPDASETREEEAGAWCMRLAAGTLAPDEQAAFDGWMAEEPANVAAFDQALTVWQALNAVSDMPEIISMRADALDALRRANQRRWSRRIGGGAGRFRLLGLAASLVLMVMGGTWLLFPATEQYSTAVGERRAFLLDDGSRISLDAQTRVAVEYEKDRRQLTLLAGRAKFDVAKDSARPFTVTAGDRTVIATGTAFSVELLNRHVHVIVYEGHVAVVRGKVPEPAALLRIKANPGKIATSLAPGAELIADLVPTAPPQIVQADAGRSLAWEGGQLDFVDEPLGTAVERLNRYTPDKLVVADARTAAIPINGVFNAGDPAGFVEAVSAAYGVHARRETNETILSAP